jgi:hypothetical protein
MSKNEEFPNGLSNNAGQVGKNLVFSAGGVGSSVLYYEDFEEYLEHPDYYKISFVVSDGGKWGYSSVVNEGGKRGYYSDVVTPLKHEYFVSYVPNAMVMNYGCLGDVEYVGK